MSELSGIELRRAVAEALGWTHLFPTADPDGLFGICPGCADSDSLDAAQDVPQYESDLNAVFQDVVPTAEEREALLRLTRVNLDRWLAQLLSVHEVHLVRGLSIREPVATAICRAFLALVKRQGERR